MGPYHAVLGHSNPHSHPHWRLTQTRRRGCIKSLPTARLQDILYCASPPGCHPPPMFHATSFHPVALFVRGHLNFVLCPSLQVDWLSTGYPPPVNARLHVQLVTNFQPMHEQSDRSGQCYFPTTPSAHPLMDLIKVNGLELQQRYIAQRREIAPCHACHFPFNRYPA